MRREETGENWLLGAHVQQDVKWLIVPLISRAQDVNLVLRLLSTAPF